MTGVFIKRGDPNTDTHRRKTMWRDKGRRQPSTSQVEGSGTESPSQHFKNNQLCWHLDFCFLASRTMKKYISVVKAIQFLILCYGKLIQVCKKKNTHRRRSSIKRASITQHSVTSVRWQGRFLFGGFLYSLACVRLHQNKWADGFVKMKFKAVGRGSHSWALERCVWQRGQLSDIPLICGL